MTAGRHGGRPGADNRQRAATGSTADGEQFDRDNAAFDSGHRVEQIG
jgi:hypothetical protein